MSFEAAVCADHGLPSSVSGLSQSGERPTSGCARRGVGSRHHLHPPAEQLCVPGYGAGRLFAQMRRLAFVQTHRYTIGYRGVRESPGHSRCEARTHSPFRSWSAVCQHSLCRAIAKLQARISMSAVGNPYDNAKAESFFKTLKQEEVYLKHYQTFEEAEANIGQFIEDVYNTKRLHSIWAMCHPANLTGISSGNAMLTLLMEW